MYRANLARRSSLALLPLLSSAIALQASAAGFAIKEQSASAQGTAFAGATATAGDPSYMFFNPASLAYQPGNQAVAVGNGILATARLGTGNGSTINGSRLSGENEIDDVAENAVVPAIYGSFSIAPDWTAGIGITAPFGLVTDYSDGWLGRYHAQRSDLKTLNFNPTLAWQPKPWLSLGFGAVAQYASAELTSAVDFGTIGAVAGIPGAVPGTADGKAQITGDDWGVGFTAGMLVEPGLPGLRLGVAYRSEVRHNLQGDADFRLDRAGIGSTISAATGTFVDTGGSAALTTPASLSVGFSQQIGDRWTVMGDVSWTQWSSFEELVIEFDNPNQPSSLTEEKWNDTFFFSLGATYRFDDKWTFRGGIAYDQSPVTDKYRTPRIPDSDRYWVSVGLAYSPSPWLTFDAALTHIFLDDADVRLKASDPGSTFRGNLDANYSTFIDLVAISARIRF